MTTADVAHRPNSSGGRPVPGLRTQSRSPGHTEWSSMLPEPEKGVYAQAQFRVDLALSAWSTRGVFKRC